MPGARQVHPDLLQNKRGGRAVKLQAIPLAAGFVPPTPRGLIPQAREVWKQLWGTNLAGAYKDSDWPGLRRWIWYLSEWLKHSKDLDPHDKLTMLYVFKCEKALRELERAYGMDALARLRLGLTLLEEHNAVKSLKEPAAPTEITE